MFDIHAIRYALAKQISCAYSLETHYGSIELDPELAEAVEAALRPILERRIEQAGKGGADHA